MNIFSSMGAKRVSDILNYSVYDLKRVNKCMKLILEIYGDISLVDIIKYTDECIHNKKKLIEEKNKTI